RFNKGVWGVAFTRDGSKLLTWGSDRTVRLWDTSTGKELRQLGGKDPNVLGVSPDGRWLALGAAKTLRLLDVEAGKEVRRFAHADRVEGGAFSPDGKTLATAVSKEVDQPGAIVLWELDSGKELSTLTGHSAAVFCMAFAPDGATLASGGYDKTIRLW